MAAPIGLAPRGAASKNTGNGLRLGNLVSGRLAFLAIFALSPTYGPVLAAIEPEHKEKLNSNRGFPFPRDRISQSHLKLAEKQYL